MKPYTYLIGWSLHNKFYYGVRFSKTCNPSDLWVSYFTSSNTVKQFVKDFGNPDIIQVRKLFDKAQDARLYEEKILKKLKAASNPLFLNKANGKAIPVELSTHFGKANGRYGKPHTEQTLEKLRKPKSLEWRNNMKGKRPHVNQTGQNNNAFKGWYLTPWGKYPSAALACKDAPFEISSSNLNTICKINRPIKRQNKHNIPVGTNPTDLGYSFISKDES